MTWPLTLAEEINRAGDHVAELMKAQCVHRLRPRRYIWPPGPTRTGGFSFFATGPERGGGKAPGLRESCNTYG